MTPFEYVSVLISIVLGLGITQLITGFADLFRHENEKNFFAPHLIWLMLVFFLHVQEWWLLYELRTLTLWRLPSFLFTLLYPVCLFVLARLLFPKRKPSGNPTLQAFYLQHYPKFFRVITVLGILSVLDNHFVHERPVTDSLIPALLSVVMLVLSVRGAPRSEALHYVIAILLLIFTLASFVWNWNTWVLVP